MDPRAKLFSTWTNLTRLSRWCTLPILWNVLREPMQRALMGLVMENGTENEQELPPDVQYWMECDAAKSFRAGEIKGEANGEIKAVRESIFRLAECRGLLLSDEQQAQLRACNDRVTLDRWFDNVFDATSADDLFL
jgi:hypothetical protein